MYQPATSGHQTANTKLPIGKHHKEILFCLETRRVLIVVGETGSGKSTFIPQILYKSGRYDSKASDNRKLICITQPRRVAAIQLAQRVAADLDCELGSKVGYAVRFDEATSDETAIKFMTEGLLQREMLFDPLLSKYSVIMIDEVHERNLTCDILLGLLKCLLPKRSDLRLIICSATLNVDEITKFFTYSDKIKVKSDLKDPAVINIQGRSYPVKTFYKMDPTSNYLEAVIQTAIDIHESHRLASGKMLIFLTGLDEVEHVCERLRDYAQTLTSRLDLKKLWVLPFHASLRAEEIAEVFQSRGRNTRVCIVSTNVAETSLTVDDVAFVIDCGFVKLKYFDHKIGMDCLVRVPISKSSANQRAGRAGRTREGSVYRMYSEDEYDKLSDSTVPELQRSALTETVMMLKSLGVDNPVKFPLISKMPKRNLIAALELLYALDAIDLKGNLTQAGELMCQFNIQPNIAKVLISPETKMCTSEACKIAAILQVKDIFVKPNRAASSIWQNESLNQICVAEGDLLSYLNIFNSFVSNNKAKRWAEKRNLNHKALCNAVEICRRLEGSLSKVGKELVGSRARLEVIQRSFVSGLFTNAAYLHMSGDYRTIQGDKPVYIHPTSVFAELLDPPKHVVFVEIINTTKAYMRHIMAVEQDWLLSAGPHFYTFGSS